MKSDRSSGGSTGLESGVAALVLAAGRARRFGAGAHETKAVADFNCVPLVRRVVETALASRARSVLVVTGHAADSVVAAVAGLPVQIIANSDHASGLAGSIQVGLAALPASVCGALILLADMPLVRADTLDRLIACYERMPGGIDAVVPTFEGQWGNPVLIGRRLFEALGRLRGDDGARAILTEPGRSVEFCPVDDPGVMIDVDTRAALDALEKGSL